MKAPDDPRRHPDATKYPDAQSAVANTFAVHIAAAFVRERGRQFEAGQDPTFEPTAAFWLSELAAFRKRIRQVHAEKRAENRKAPGTKQERREAEERNERLRLRVEAEVSRLEKLVKGIAGLPTGEQRARMHALWINYVKPRTELHGEVSGKALAAPDWDAVTGKLQKASSEPSILRLERAFERGEFDRPPDADYPLADVSGRLGAENITVHAELRPDLDTQEGREIMAQLAERLRDPRLALGPRVQQTIQALMSFWLTRRNADGYVTVHIGQLADALGYEKTAQGYHPAVYEDIRHYVDAASQASLQGVMPKGMTITGNPNAAGRFQERAFAFTYFDEVEGKPGDRPIKRWLTLGFRPGAYFAAITQRQGALYKGFDKELNRLHPVRERPELLLGKYLETHFRLNWNKGRGVLKRSVQQLLSEGMGLRIADLERPNREALERLSSALDLLNDRGTVKHWQADAAWDAVWAKLEPVDGKARRMTRELWAAVLGASIEIDAGSAYHEQYKTLGLTHQDGGSADLVAELRQYLTNDPRPQRLVAQELGIDPSLLSRILKGERKVSPELRERIERLLQQGRTLPLFR